LTDEDTDNDDERVRRRPLSREERRDLDEVARPGAVYRESGWRKQAPESLDSIRRAVDQLDDDRAERETRRRGDDELPTGLRSRITEALGSVAYVQHAYTTDDHHVCHAGVRTDDGVDDRIVLVAPGRVRTFEDVAAAVDALVDEVDAEVDVEAGGDTGRPVAQRPPDAGEDPFGYVYEVRQIEGIADTYGEALDEQGIATSRELWHADPEQLADALDVATSVVADWQLRAELMAVRGLGPQYAELLARSGVRGVQDLRDRDPGELLGRIQDKQDELQVRIQGNLVSEHRVASWVEAARDHEPED
jgi:predicted flap endonuclease-1-like 5' DNA nuclease